MATCPKCGAEANEGDEFCPFCSTSLRTKPGEKVEKEGYALGEKDVCFGEREHRRDYFGLVSFGIFLVIVGFIFIANPSVISDFTSWIELMTREKTLRRPSLGLIDSATLFFCLLGSSNFFIAGIRFMADKSKVMRQVLTNILTGVALVLFSYLIYLYGHTPGFAWQTVLAIEVVAIGLIVIFYSSMRYLFPKRLQ